MIPRRTALVATSATSSGTGSGVAAVTMPRLPWEPEITGPDPRHETAPGVGSIRNADLNERTGPMAPAKSFSLARHFEAQTTRVHQREVR